MKNRPGSNISHKFKTSVVMLVFFLALFRLLDIFYFPVFNPGIDLVSDKIILVIVLLLVVYLWVQEAKDYHHLLMLNQNLRVAHEQLQQAELESITALMNAEESKDPYTYGHSDRVTQIALIIATEMGLDGTFKETLRRAGLLHDIGKIGIQDAILLKKEKLTVEEWEIIKSHSRKGADILAPLNFLSEVKNIILYHHERFDGKGYPAGLKDGQIPLGSLILAVADAFDAMNSQRPYRETLPRDTIIAELKKGRGSQHQPEITDILLGLLEKNPQLWNK